MAAFYRSIDQYGVKYTRYIGDGSSATFKGLLNLNPNTWKKEWECDAAISKNKQNFQEEEVKIQ